jgi:6-phospho-beta-glucosidase
MSRPTNRKFALIGGGGVRTPLVIFGINESAEALGADELVLYDPDAARLRIMAELGRAIVAKERGTLRVREAASLEDAIEGADFVLNSIRIGGIATRAADERAAIQHGYPGQETTGPVGAAMALRTVPVAIEQARLVERLSPKAWIVSFTNPAGLITQAITQHTNARIVGICDTPTELFHNIAHALGEPFADVVCDYIGLNHLGWVRRVLVRGEDVTDRVLASDTILAKLYSAPLFDFEMIRTLRLIPTEYLFFYYSRTRAHRNQLKHGSSRGTEVDALNRALIQKLADRLGAGDGEGAIAEYAAYLNRRSGSYMRLEASAGSAFDADASFNVDPFRVASGYHRIAIDVMLALTGARPGRIVVNTRNDGAVSNLPDGDVVELPCRIEQDTIAVEKTAPFPDAVLGLVQSVKAYERATIEAALTSSRLVARKALLIHPAIGEWDPSDALLRDLWDPTCIHC